LTQAAKVATTPDNDNVEYFPERKKEHFPDTTRLDEVLDSEVAAMLEATLNNTCSFLILNKTSGGRTLRFSDYTTKKFGLPSREMRARTFAELVDAFPVYDMSGRPLLENERITIRALRGEAVRGVECLLETADGERIPVVANASPVRNARGELIGAITSSTDLRPYKALERNLREAVAQREALYMELTHRVKNHLQILASLISLDARDPDLPVKVLAERMSHRIAALGAVYKGLTLEGGAGGARIEALPFLDEVCRPYGSASMTIKVEIDPSDLSVSSDQASSVGMLVNEAVCNSWKHAFPNGGGGVWVRLHRPQSGRLRLIIADDGVGWPAGRAAARMGHHGLEVMRLCAERLGGELELGQRPGGGSLVAVEFGEIGD